VPCRRKVVKMEPGGHSLSYACAMAQRAFNPWFLFILGAIVLVSVAVAAIRALIFWLATDITY
jgi:hypothetical protein